MRLLAVRGRAFRSLGSFALALAKQGKVLVVGQNEDELGTNAAGKTNLLQSVVWAIGGTQAVGVTPRRVVNERLRGGCEVILDLELTNGANMTIERYMRHAKMRDRLVVKVDGADLTRGTNTETQRVLEQQLGMSFDLFTQAFYFSAGGRSLLSFTDGQRKDVFDVLVHGKTLDRAAKLARSGKVEQEQKLSEAGVELALSVRHQQVLQTEATRAKAHLQQEQERWRKAESTRRNRLLGARLELRALRKQECELNESLQQAEVRKDTTESVWRDCDLALAHNATELEHAKQALRDLSGLRGGSVCDKCGSTMTGAVLTARRQERVGALTRLRVLRDDLRRKKVAYQIDYANAAEQLQDLTEQQRELHQRRAIVESAAQHAEEAVVYDGTTEARVLCENRLTELRQVNQQRLSWLLRERVLRSKVVRYGFWVTAYGKRIKEQLIAQLIPLLNTASSYYADLLSVGALTVRWFSTSGDDPRLRFEMTSKHGGQLYELQSSAEGRRVDMIVRRAMQDVARSFVGPCNTRMYDEPFLNCGPDLIDLLMDLFDNELQTLAAESVFITTVEEGMEGRFERVITVVKKHGVSRIL